MSQKLPQGFVYLEEIDASIQQSVRYASDENFLGCQVDGYLRPTIIMTEAAAQALHRLQTSLLTINFGLLVYDAYRPEKAVSHFVRWSEDHADELKKGTYYPTLEKKEIFERGFVAKRSTHSRGSTVDLTLIDRTTKVHPIESLKVSTRCLTDGRDIPFLEDGSLDMGASFDLFDNASHHDTTLVSEECLERRNFLRKHMKNHGFKDYAGEWWHYMLLEEPFPETYFDFNVD